MSQDSSRKRFAFLRSGSLLIGLILAIAAFVAFFFLGNVLNPPPYQVVIVIQEVAPGDTLQQYMLATDPQQVHPKVAGEYVLAHELNEWLGTTVNEPLHPGDPLTKARLVKADNPAAARHLAIGLEEPDRVVMVVPVDPETSPSRILPGDRVNVSFSIGQVQQTVAQSGGVPFPQQVRDAAQAQPPTPVPPSTFTLPGEEVEGGYSADRQDVPTGDKEELESWVIPAGATVLEEKEIGEETSANLPLSKIVLQNVDVLDVHYEERPNPAYSGDDQGGAPPFIQGEILSLEVVIPAGAVEMLHFAIENGSVRIALLSPNAGEEAPTLGMTWEDMEAFFEAERKAVLGIEDETEDTSAELPARPVSNETSSSPASEEITGTLPVTSTIPQQMRDATQPTTTLDSESSIGPDTEGAAPAAAIASTSGSEKAEPSNAPEKVASTATEQEASSEGEVLDLDETGARLETLPEDEDTAPLSSTAGDLAGMLPFLLIGIVLIVIPLAVFIIMRRRRKATVATPAAPVQQSTGPSPSIEVQG